MRTVDIGWRSGLVSVRVMPSTRNHYAVQMGASEALKLAKDIEAVISDPSSSTAGGVLGDRPVGISRFGSKLYLTVCGDGKTYRTSLTEDAAREVVRRLKHATGM